MDYFAWRRRGARGEPPSALKHQTLAAVSQQRHGPEATSGILATVSSELALRTHVHRYGRWLVDQLRARGQWRSNATPRARWMLRARFDIGEDWVLMHPRAARAGVFMDVVLIMVDGVLFMAETSHPKGIARAVRDGDLELRCGPSNVLEVVEGAKPPPEDGKVDVKLDDIPDLARERYGETGIPAQLVADGTRWADPWPIDGRYFSRFDATSS